MADVLLHRTYRSICGQIQRPCALSVELTRLYPAPIQRVLSPRQRASRSSSSVSMMAKPVQLPAEDSFASFDEAVLKRELPVMVYFHAM